jgi:two-component system response regulator YesN
MMLKLLIADDEYLVTDSIKYIVEKYIQGVEVVGTASTGREAIEKSVVLKPDIVFMDIQMPGIDGIEAIKRIKAANSSVVFVIITAYEYFNYAREAVGLGVYEYILKPINKNKVVETINEICKLIAKKREDMQKEMILKERMNKIIPHLEGQFVYSRLFDGRRIKDIGFYEEIFGMDLRYGYVMMAIVEDQNENGREGNFKISLEKQKLYDIFNMELKNLCNCLVGPPMLDRVAAYIIAEKKSDPYVVRNKAINIATKLSKKLERETNLRYRIGIGRSCGIEDSMRSCNEACIAASIRAAGSVSHFEDIQASGNGIDTYPENQEKELIQRLLSGDEDGVIEAFETIFLWMSMNFKEDLDRIKSKLLELIFVVKRAVSYHIEEDNMKDQSFLTGLLKLQHGREIKSIGAAYLKYIVSSMAESRQKEMNGIIAKVLKYINENYDKDINMNDAAKATNLSYHYFSKFFKDSTGKSFVEYLTDLRIEKSKVFLADTNNSIKEISYKIGYSDPNYYCKTFKRMTGMTPTEYRDNISAHEVVVSSAAKQKN